MTKDPNLFGGQEIEDLFFHLERPSEDFKVNFKRKKCHVWKSDFAL
jgi:hypothetical protein